MGKGIRALRRSGMAATAILLAACNPLARPSLNAYRPLESEPAPAVPEGELIVRFGGTSTLVLSDGLETIMIDGFFTRPSTFPMVLAPLRTDPDRVKAALRELGVKLREPGSGATVKRLFVAHSHHDHVMDSALVAELTGAELIGSQSTAHVVRDRAPSRPVTVPRHGQNFPSARFRVTVLETPHSPKEFGPLKGSVRRSLRRERWLGDYRADTSHAYFVEHPGSGRRILIVPSAAYEIGAPNPFRGYRPDLVFLAVAKVGRKPVAWGQEYWCRTVRATQAKQVVAIHWDDIRRPLGKPLKTIPRAQDRFHRGMRILMPLALRDQVRLSLPRPYLPIDLGPRSDAAAREPPPPCRTEAEA